MPIDPISLSMMLGSVALNFITNSKNSKKQAEKQAAQKEFQRAQAEHDFQRMREAQERAIQLNKEIEAELHAQRLEDIESNYDDIIDQIAKDKVIKNWPITLLPFVMKGQRFGSFIGSGIQSIVMHCILTPSNNKWFNENIYKDLDYQVQAYINDKWHSHSTHPVLYHGGGWKNAKEIDLNQIDQLRTCLKSVPTMVITPYFDVDTSLLYFRISIWGMGKNQEIKLQPQSNDVGKRIFSYDYVCGQLPPENADEYDFKKTTLEEFVPYLVCLIGFMADRYYWSAYHIPALLPSVFGALTVDDNGTFAKDLLSYISKSYLDDCNQYILNTIDTVDRIPTTVDYIETLKPFFSSSDYKTIEKRIISISDSMITEEDANYSKNLCDVKKYWTEVLDDLSKLTLVNIQDLSFKPDDIIKKESINLADIIEQFRVETNEFCGSYDFGLYIEQKDYQCFSLFMFNKDKKQIFTGNRAFHKCFFTNSLEHVKNVKSIFGHKNHSSIFCPLEKVEKLVQRINERNELVF